jgi:hypothetical protein
MRALLICPAERPAVALLAESAPLALLPLLGKSLIEFWLEHLGALGATVIYVLAADRPGQIRAFVADGARWGVRIEVLPETRELTPAEARLKYHLRDDTDWLPTPHDVHLVDCHPALPDQRLFNHYGDWLATSLAWLPHALTADRIGVRELRPGIWVGLNTRVAPGAELRAPCWLGENVRVETNTIIGPGAIIENRAFVSAGAEVSQSVVAPETYVGELTEVANSVAWGNLLIHWRDGSCTRVPDPFLLCSLAGQPAPPIVSLTGRLAAAMAMTVTAPFAAVAALLALCDGRRIFRTAVAVRTSGPAHLPRSTIAYRELDCEHRWLRRWPQFWNVIQGNFALVGNRPLTPAEALVLTTDFERLWLAAPIGLISLADAEACADPLGDEARAHASYYAVRGHWRLDLAILARVITRTPFENTAQYDPVDFLEAGSRLHGPNPEKAP